MTTKKRSRSMIFAPSGTERDLSSSILSFQAIDTIINEKQQELSQSQENKQGLQTSEAYDLSKLDKAIKGPLTNSTFNAIFKLLERTKSNLVRSQIEDIFIGPLLTPNDAIDGKCGLGNQVRGQVTGKSGVQIFITLLNELPNFFRFFSPTAQVAALEALPNTLALLAPDTRHLDKIIPFHAYSTCANTCTEVLKVCFEMHIDEATISKYIAKVLSMMITISENISQVVQQTKTRLPAYSGYVGELMPFAAAIESVRPQGKEDILRLLQQYWIILIIFSFNNTTIFFSSWAEQLDTLLKFMPPLVHNAARGNFASVKFRVQELLNLIKPQELQKTSDLVQVFSKILPMIPTKTVLSLELADAICLLSIYVLEELRATHGIFGPIFAYIEGEYYQTFTSMLDAMFVPIYNVFTKSLENMSDFGRKMECVKYAMTTLIERYTSKIPRIQTCVDQLFVKFAELYPVVLTTPEVIEALSSTRSLISEASPQRQQVFDKTTSDLFAFSTARIPYAFFASLIHFLEKTASDNFRSNKPPFLTFITQKLPHEFCETFINEYILRTSIYGQAQFATLDQIRAIKNENDRILLLSAYIRLHPEEKDLFEELLVPANSHILLMAWSDVAMQSSDLSNSVIRKMVNFFNTTVRSRLGIFAGELDIETINLQAAIIRFLIEQVTIGYNPGFVGQVIVSAAEVTILRHPAVIGVLFPLAYLGCMTIQSGITFSASSSVTLKTFILKLIFTAYSFIDDPLVFKYIGEIDLVHLEMLATVIPDIAKVSLQVDNEPISISGSVKSISNISVSSYARGRVPKIIQKANLRAQQNYISSVAGVAQIIPTLYSIANFLLCTQLQLFSAYILQGKVSASVQRLLALNQMKKSVMHLTTTLPLIWKLAPGALYPICNNPLIGNSAISIAAQLVQQDIFSAARVPEIALLFNRSERFNRQDLSIWHPINPLKAFSLLTPEIMNEKGTARYVIRCFEKFNHEEGLLFIPQLVQALRFDACGVLREFLIKRSANDEIFCHYLLWNILGEKDNHVSAADNLPEIITGIEQEILANFNDEQRESYQNEFGLIDELDRVSQQLLPLDIPDRPSALNDKLKDLHLAEKMYIPSNPQYKIVSIDEEHSVPLKSHARVPILVRFNVYDENDEEKKIIPFSCIFKIQDDVRQDAMMIQFIDCFKRIFIEAGIDCFLFPYRVFSTGPNRGVIECIPNSKSRHDIGQSTDEDLLTYFINKYGQVGSPEFTRAQENFIKSVAPYSLICYLFEVKDRHNANIMLDEDGHVIHIDFGFIFEISPGGVQFERAPFKLTKEMIDVMGGSKESPAFQSFVTLITKCLFAVRARHEEIEAIADLMRSAGFPCFRADSIKKLSQRFCVGMTPKEVVQTVQELVNSSYEAYATIGYDAFQFSQNRIYF